MNDIIKNNNLTKEDVITNQALNDQPSQTQSANDQPTTNKPKSKATVNFRPIVVACLIMMLAIVAYVNSAAFLCVFGVVAFVVLSIATKDGQKRIIYVIFAIAILLGTLSPYLVDLKYNSKPQSISGKMTATVLTMTVDGQAVVSDITINGKTYGKGIINTDKILAVGDIITFEGQGSRVDLLNDYHLRGGFFEQVEYELYANKIELLSEKKISLAILVREFYKSTMMQFMSKDSFAAFYGMLFGDTSYMLTDKLQSMRLGGIAHVFAVSGLHVGVLYAFLSKLLSSKSAKTKLAVIFPILVLYAYVCGFTPSIMRATAMLTLALLAEILGLHNDKLTTLASSAIITLALSPYSLFSCGFVLSFTIVGTIYLTSKNVEKLFPKKRDVGGAFRVSVCASLGSLPLSSYYFGNLSLLSLPLNIICVPLLSALFMAVIVITPITAVLGLNVLAIVDLIYSCLSAFIDLIISTNLGIFNYSMPILPLLFIFASYFCLSDYLIWDNKSKKKLFLLLFTLSVIMCVVI